MKNLLFSLAFLLFFIGAVKQYKFKQYKKDHQAISENSNKTSLLEEKSNEIPIYRNVTSEMIDVAKKTEMAKIESAVDTESAESKHREKLLFGSQVENREVIVESKIPDSLVKNKIENEEPAEVVKSFFTLKFNFDYQRYDSTDAFTNGTSVILSNLNPNAGVSWNQQWSDVLTTAVFLDLSYITLQTPSNKTLEKDSVMLSSAGFNVDYKANEKINLISTVKVGQNIFWKANTQSSLKPILIPTISLNENLKYNVAKKKHLRLNLLLGAGYLSSASSSDLSVNPGFSYNAGFEIESTHPDQPLIVGLGYQKTNQNTDLAKQSSSQIMLFMQYNFGSVKSK